MPAEATMKEGSPRFVNRLAGANIAAGEVLVIGVQTFVAHSAIANGKMGGVSAGGGVYRMLCAAAYAEGVKVYWDNAANKITTTAGGNQHFGYMAPNGASTGVDTYGNVIHEPNN